MSVLNTIYSINYKRRQKVRTGYSKSALLSPLLAFAIVVLAISLLHYVVLAAPSQAYGTRMGRRDFSGSPPAQSWDASVTATFPGGSDDAFFGAWADATSDFDNSYDIPEPPAPPEPPYVRAYFYYPEQTPDELHRSCLAPENLMEWPLRIEYADDIEDITLTWSVENIPSDYKVLLYRGGASVADMRAEDYYTFEAASGDHDFRIVVRLPAEYTLTISSTAGGTTDPPPGSHSYPADTVVWVTAYPVSGYRFVRWELDGVPKTMNPIDVPVDRNHSLHAVFEAIPPGPSLGVRVSISPENQDGAQGETLRYVVTITNTGDSQDTYDLVASDNAGWNPSLSKNSLTIPSKASDTVTLSVTIPGNASVCTVDGITVVATSETNSNITGSDSCTAHVIQAALRVVRISITPENQSGAPGATLNYTVEVTNGNDQLHVFDLQISGGAGWEPRVSPSSLTLAAGASGTATLSVTVPSGVSGGSSVGIAVTATSREDPTLSDSASCIARIAVVPGVRVFISPSEDSGSPGTTLKYTVTVANTGNVIDTYDLAVTDGAGWNLELPSSTLTISMGGSEEIALNVTIPENAEVGTADDIIITATSQVDPSISDSASCRAIAAAPSVLPLTVPLIGIAIIIIFIGGYLFLRRKGGRRRRVLYATAS